METRVGFTLDGYDRTRPFLYHLTAPEKVGRIRSMGRLQSTASIRREGTDGSPRRTRRACSLQLRVSDGVVVIRDQAPLYEANIEFSGGWTMEKLLEELDRRVFFWPGKEDGPIDYGERHFARYKPEGTRVLRMRFASLLARNPTATPYFSRHNSGSPRYSKGKASPRGPDTFLPAERCAYPPGRVVEVTFLDELLLPEDAELSEHIGGPWSRLQT